MNNKGADHPALPRSMISALLIAYRKVAYLDLIQVKFQFSSYSPCTRAGWFESHFVGSLEDRFSCAAAHLNYAFWECIKDDKRKVKLCTVRNGSISREASSKLDD